MLSGTLQNEHDTLAQQTLGEGTQLLRAVTQLADKREVVASEDIFSKSGIKLVSSGTQLSGQFYEKLVAHKLLKPVEESLSVTGALSASALVLLAFEEAVRVPALAPLLAQPETLERIQGYFHGVEVPAPLALKLTVMQVERPQLFRHSLLVSVLSVVLGVRANLPKDELQALALASAFHDMGELCIDPDILAPQHLMNGDERRYLTTHPITGYLMVRGFKELPPAVAEGVWQHHERLDGSGYPYGLTGEQIGNVARYLAVAEFVSSLLEKNGADKRISMKLRLNLNKYDGQAVGIVCALFGDASAGDEKLPSESVLITRLTQVGELFEGWMAFRKTLSPVVIDEIAYFAERVESLRMMVLEPGYDQCRLEDLLPQGGQGCSEICHELTVLLDELSWQLKDLIQVLERKLATRGWSLPASRRNDFNGWMAQVQRFVAG
ncbi:MAG: HD domain-containing phosphohydrolase [Betaproteobacteria bacterium]